MSWRGGLLGNHFCCCILAFAASDLGFMSAPNPKIPLFHTAYGDRSTQEVCHLNSHLLSILEREHIEQHPACQPCAMTASDHMPTTRVSPACQPESSVIPWLSILIPVYNVERYVRECVESILAQIATSDVEVLLLDDASTDTSAKTCRELTAEFPAHLRLLEHDRNRGLSAARNTLLEAARGEYIWFVDSDDRMLPGAIPQLREIVEREAPDLVLCDYRRRGRNHSTFKSCAVSDGDNELVCGIFAAGRLHIWTKIARRNLWGIDLRFPEDRTYEDILTTPRLCRRAQHFHHAAQPWIEYRVRNDSITAMGTRVGQDMRSQRLQELATAVRDGAAHWKQWLPDEPSETRLWVAAYCAGKFSTIAGRLIRACVAHRSLNHLSKTLRQYRQVLEFASPVPFIQLVPGLLRRRQIFLGLVLAALLAIAHRKEGDARMMGSFT